VRLRVLAAITGAPISAAAYYFLLSCPRPLRRFTKAR
jgi:hypothetical protein